MRHIRRVLLVAGFALAYLMVVAWGTGGAFAQDRIAAIQIEGNQRIEPDTVRSYIRIGVGDRFDSALINTSLKSLFATGLFADVSIRRAGADLVVNVVENPIVNQLAFEGNRRIEDETLEAEVQLRQRVVYTRTRVRNDVQRVLQIYRRGGRFAATIEPKIIQLPQNRVDVVFEIAEGPVTKVEKITVIGNKRFPDGRLRTELATKEDRWYRLFSGNDTYDPDRLSFDRELLRRFYLSKGYADFRVVSGVAELAPDRSGFFVTFTVDEGEIYQFGEIDVRSELRDLPREQLLQFVKTATNENYNADQVEDTIQDLTFEVGKLGYAFIDIKPEIKRDRDKRIIDVTYVIDEGPRVYVERIQIAGNVRTLDRVIRREFELNEGDAYNTAKIRKSRRNIRGLGFFDKVDIREEQGSTPDRTNVLVDVEERSTGELTIGFGFSTSDSVLGDVSIRERNLLGRGQDLRLGLSVSNVRQQVDLSFTEPYFLGRNLAAGFDIFKIQRDLQSESSFDEDNIGFSLRAGFPIAENLRQSVRYTLRKESIENVGVNASRFIRDQVGERTISSVGYTLTYDRRDDKLDPTTGYVIVFGQDFAGLLGSVRFLKTSLDYAYHFPVAEQWVAKFAISQGYIVGIGQDTSIGDRFFVGGTNFRGFQTAGIGPRDLTTDDALGGNVYYVGTAELSFPLGLPNEFGILGRVFSEVGSLAQIDSAGPGLVDKGSARLASGVGVSWRSPFGPIRVDFAVPLLKEDFDQEEAFRFSFGTRF